jgi:alpha-mannosidase
MKWNSMLMHNQWMGGYAEARYPAEVVEYVDTDPSFIARYPYSVIGAFGKGWDDLKTLTAEFVTVAQDKSTENRRVIVSNQQDFFEDFEAAHGSEIATVACSFGNEWDLECAALAEVSASVKRSVERLRGAEALETLTSLVTIQSSNPLDASREQAWMDLGLFWEHNFGMVYKESNQVNERIAWQRRLAGEIKGYVDTLETGAVAKLGRSIKKTGSNLRFFAFNPLSWARTGVAEIPYADPDPVYVFDIKAGVETPSQVVTVGGERRLRILAKNVPALGYKVFAVRPGEGEAFTNAASVEGNVIENASYRVTLDGRGAITSLIDKNRAERQFVRVINGRALNDLGEGSGTVEVENAGAVSVTLKASASAPLAHTTRLTFVRNAPYLEIHNEITQNFDSLETWGFGFEIDSPEVWHEEVGAVMRARLLSQGGHYTDRAGNARYDWLTLNHFADMSGGGVGVTLSNADCYFMKLGDSTVTSLDSTTPFIAVLAGGRVVDGTNGLPGQGGDSTFLQRFALQTHDAFEAVAAMRFALEHQNPLVTGIVTGGEGHPAESYSFMSVSNPNVLVWALKPHEDGILKGVVVRVWNLSAVSEEFTLTVAPGSIVAAQRLTHIETPVGEANVLSGGLVDTLVPQQIQTYALFFENGPLLEPPPRPIGTIIPLEGTATPNPPGNIKHICLPFFD